MADIEIKAAYASVVEDDGTLFIGFAEGEEEDEGYVLFRQPVEGGPIWFEVTDEAFGGENAVESVVAGPEGFEVIIQAQSVGAFGWARVIAVTIGPEAEGRDDAFAALEAMMGPHWRKAG
jgi:hypothetical protein